MDSLYALANAAIFGVLAYCLYRGRDELGTLRWVFALVTVVCLCSLVLAVAFWFAHGQDTETLDRLRLGVAFLSSVCAIGLAIVAPAMVAELGRARQARFEQARLASIIETSTDSIVSYDLDGRVVSWNRAAEQLYGYSAAEIIGQSVLSIFPQAGQEELAELIARVRAGESIPFFDTQRVRRDGSLAMVSLAVSPIRTRSGRVIGASAISRNIEEERIAQERLRRAERMELVGQLAGGVAHDFNNLLTIIRLHADFLDESLPREDELRSEVQSIKQASERASAITKQLLAFGRRTSAMLRVIDLGEEVDRLLDVFRRALPDRITLSFTRPSHQLTVRIDPLQLEQVLLNLIINARDAIADEGTIELQLAGEKADSETVECRARLTVIFEPFFTTREVGKGSGLGLSAARSIIEEAGGSIGVSSAVGAGTRVEIRLPITSAEVTIPEGRGRGLNALVVDDDEAARQMVVDALEEQGVSVYEAPNGSEALSIMVERIRRLDMLFADTVMPLVGGERLVADVRQRFPEVKVVVMTTQPTFGFRSHGAPIRLRKPINRAQLGDLIDRLLPEEGA
jgi:two-component system, cell cycle sensor histidine kinase and response regulator CckA